MDYWLINSLIAFGFVVYWSVKHPSILRETKEDSLPYFFVSLIYFLFGVSWPIPLFFLIYQGGVQ